MRRWVGGAAVAYSGLGKYKAMTARKFLISGTVQGVGYRFFAEREARALGLRGYVKNLADGRVEVYAIGGAGPLDRLKRRLAAGPRSASVDRVEEADQPVENRYADFRIEA